MKAIILGLMALCLVEPGPPAAAAVGVDQPGVMRPDLYAKGMYLIITGSGSALADPERGGASAAVIVDGQVLQFDLGRMALENLERAGVKPTQIDYLFFTHLHFDHIASYPYFLISDWIAGRQGVVRVYGPAGTEAMTQGDFLANADNVGFGHDVYKNWAPSAPGRIAPEPPFAVKDVVEGPVASGPNFKVTALKTVHFTYPGAMQQSLAYRVDSPYGSVVVSGDTSAMPQMSVFAKDADFLVHEVQRPDPGMAKGGKMVSPEFGKTLDGKPRNGGGHTSPTEVGIVAAQAGVKTLIATHLPPYTSDDAAVALSAPYTGPAPGFQIWGEYIGAIKKNFSGNVVLAQDAMVFKVGQPD